MDDRMARKLRARRRQRAQKESEPEPAPPPKRIKAKRKTKTKQTNEVVRGFYICCTAFYVGWGWTKNPPCPKCGKKSRQAKRLELEDAYDY